MINIKLYVFIIGSNTNKGGAIYLFLLLPIEGANQKMRLLPVVQAISQRRIRLVNIGIWLGRHPTRQKSTKRSV